MRAITTRLKGAIPKPLHHVDAGAHLRPFSSTPSSSFLFFNRPKPSVANLLADLDAARAADRLDKVSKLYPTLIEEAKRVDSRAPWSSDSLDKLMSYVSKTPRFDLLLRIFNDLPTFNIVPSLLNHRYLLFGMVRAGKWTQAVEWIERMESSHGLVPRTREWNVLLSGMAKKEKVDELRDVWGKMKARGVAFNVHSYTSLISALFKSGDVEGVREAQRAMKEEGLESDVQLDTTLLNGFVEAGELGSARMVRDRLESQPSPTATGAGTKPLDTYAVNALLKLEGKEGGYKAALKKAMVYRDQGIQLDGWTVTALAMVGGKELANAKEAIALVEELQECVGAEVNRRTWTIALQGVLAGPGGIDEGLKVYQEARDRSVAPDSTFIQPLLTALLLPKPNPASFAVAKTLYEDLATSSTGQTQLGPDVGVYISLLRACADPTSPDLDFSKTLLADMRTRGIRLLPESVTWHIVALMRASKDYLEAFAAYDTMRALEVQALNATSYNTILAAFTTLEFVNVDKHPRYVSKSPIAPPKLIQEFLSDMRRSGHPPDVYTYSILLAYYGRSNAATLGSVKAIHSLIKLDRNIDPDIGLFNALMMAYSRVGEWVAVHGIWEGLRANRNGCRIDAHSVSIIIDTCGWQGKAAGKVRGREIWNELKRERFEFTLKNWESMVECLCRWGDFDTAERLVFEEMGSKAQATTFETLLRFSRMDPGRWPKLWRRIKEERPDVWEQVKDVALPGGEIEGGRVEAAVLEGEPGESAPRH